MCDKIHCASASLEPASESLGPRYERMEGVWYMISGLEEGPAPGMRKAGGAKGGGLPAVPVLEASMRDVTSLMPVRSVSMIRRWAWLLAQRGLVLRFLELTVFRLIADVCVGYACCLEGEANELAAPWDAGPVEQLIRWIGACFLVGGHGVEALDACYAVSSQD